MFLLAVLICDEWDVPSCVLNTKSTLKLPWNPVEEIVKNFWRHVLSPLTLDEDHLSFLQPWLNWELLIFFRLCHLLPNLAVLLRFVGYCIWPAFGCATWRQNKFVYSMRDSLSPWQLTETPPCEKEVKVYKQINKNLTLWN